MHRNIASRGGHIVGFVLMWGLLLGGVGCVGPFRLSLQYDPSDPPVVPGTIWPSGRVKLLILPAEDARANKAELGRTTSRGFTSVPIVASSGSPAQYVHDAMRMEFGRLGVVEVRDSESANRILAVEVREFSVNESTSYVGRI